MVRLRCSKCEKDLKVCRRSNDNHDIFILPCACANDEEKKQQIVDATKRRKYDIFNLRSKFFGGN